MTDLELTQLRREKWRLNGKPIRTIEQARAFLEDVGFCLMYPQRSPLLAPTFIGAFVGSDDRLPGWQHAFKDPRATEATELMVRLLRDRSAFEANLVEENNGFLVAASVFPYFYALVGERNPRLLPKAGSRSPYSALACDAFELIGRDGPISKQKMQEKLGGSVSFPALDDALGELWSKLRITRVDYNASEGSSWDVLYRWAPDAVKEGVGLSVPEALTALLTKYLDCVVSAELVELENFFGRVIARSKVKEAVNALLAARELSFIHVGGKSMLQITPEKVATAPAPRNAVEDAARRAQRVERVKEKHALRAPRTGVSRATRTRVGQNPRRPARPRPK
jgi:hypothetical protein